MSEKLNDYQAISVSSSTAGTRVPPSFSCVPTIPFSELDERPQGLWEFSFFLITQWICSVHQEIYPQSSRLILKVFCFHFIYLFVYYEGIYNNWIQTSMPLILKFLFWGYRRSLPNAFLTSSQGSNACQLWCCGLNMICVSPRVHVWNSDSHVRD